MQCMTELVMHVEPGRKLSWGSHLPGWLFGAEQWVVLNDVDGGTKTKFELIAVFRGLVPWLMMASLRELAMEAIKAMAQGIKTAVLVNVRAPNYPGSLDTVSAAVSSCDGCYAFIHLCGGPRVRINEARDSFKWIDGGGDGKTRRVPLARPRPRTALPGVRRHVPCDGPMFGW
ncbi:hypothetical protein C8F04DRAFT_1347528 [Mycena alexandri]|uniref:Uncharacterized protein n=1 Tax=Mycena alexandri TaxID=1745969 RepID=A0AAD6SVM5_9AGAR|nr:hypothetical protein C8F04DRAFT_1347528 [Mycena alexandri]